VGELLIDADYQARTLLLDADSAAAPGLLRTWVRTVAEAAELWNAFPREGADASGRFMERVSEVAGSFADDLASARWPGPGPGDDRLRAVGHTLARARGLVERYRGEINPRLPEVQEDLEAARTRVVHTLYIATHVVVVALRDDGRQRAISPTRTEALRAIAARDRDRDAVGPGVRWADRLGVAERILGTQLRSGRYAEALTHEQTAAVEGLPRLQAALARFDIQAHRTLVEAPTPGNLVLLTRTEGMFFGAALTLARAAAQAAHAGKASGIGQSGIGQGEIERGSIDFARIERSLTTAGEAWMGLARRWRDLMPQGARIDPPLGEASAQLRSACRELTHSGDHLAPLDVVAQRVDLASTIPVLAHSVDAAAELAEATRPALRQPDLVAPPRAVAHRLTEDIEEGLFLLDTDLVRTTVNGLTARGNRLAPVPQAALDAIDGAAARATLRSASAASAMSSGAALRRTEVSGAVPAPQAVRREEHASAHRSPLSVLSVGNPGAVPHGI
jgi:hypothetical protein